MALKIIRNDILKMKVDAIVNPTDEQLSGSGSIDWKIHHICGDSLKDELKNIGNLKEGQAIITNASNLPCKYIIHTVGPTYKNKNEDFTILENSYKNSLSLAMDNNIKSIAFPLIATGTFEFPIEQAIPIAINTIKSFLAKNEIDVYLAVYSSEAFGISKKIITDIESFIDDEDIEKENDVLANYLAPFQEKVINEKEIEYLRGLVIIRVQF